MALTIKKQLAPVKPNINCFGYGNNKLFLVIHQTGNPSVGANAAMHARLQSNGWGSSWHYSVDDKEAIQSFEHSVSCYHASDGTGDGNMNSIAIEGCINADGNYVQSVKNMAELAAKILLDEKIPIENMKQHYDFARDKKNCPTQIRAGKDGINWAKFVDMVKAHLVPPAKPSTKFKRGELVQLRFKGATHWASIKTGSGNVIKNVEIDSAMQGKPLSVEWLNADGTISTALIDDTGRIGSTRYTAYEHDLIPFTGDEKYYRVQVGAFKAAENAKKKADELNKKGENTYIVKD